MLTQTINAYAFKQFADDDDVQLFFGMFNAASQDYLDWFNANSLAYYPGLSGPLLQWVAAGLYGQRYFSAIEAAATPAVGPLNTAALNTITLNSYVAPTETYYAITDDIFQRILTWNIYKGDGKRFCVRWLKRRIMRFLLGVNGIDPQPWNDGFVVGCENTQGVSVQFAQSYLAAPPQTAPTLNTASSSLPASTTYYFKVVAVNGFGSSLPSSEQSQTTSATANDSTITVNFTLPAGATGGQVWFGTSAGGEAAYFPVAAGASSFTFSTTSGATSASIPTANTALNGQTCTISLNQLVLSAITQLTPNILQTFKALFLAPGNAGAPGADWVLEKPLEYDYVVNIETSLTALVSPGSLSTVGASASESTGAATVSALGGSGAYTYAWAWISGGTGVTINSPTADVTTFTASSLTSGETLTGVAQCTVTDTSLHTTATCSVNVSIERVSTPTATASPTSVSTTGLTTNITSGQVQVTATGGEGPYQFAWSWQSGGSNISIDSPTTASTTFTAIGLSYGQQDSGTALCTVTDSFGQVTTCTVPVAINRVTQLGASISPNSLAVTGASSSESTGSTTVTPSGGVAPYSYSWAWQSGGSGIAIGSPSSATTSFTGNSLSPGTTDSGTAVCTVTDSSGQQAQVTCSVSIARVSLVSASVSPGSQSSGSGATTQTTGASTVTASGGSGSYSYSWSWISGGSNIAINSPYSASTSFTGSGMSAGNTYSGTAQCTVTDGYGQTTTVDVTVSVSCYQYLFTYSGGSGSQTVPSWASNVVVEVWGGGGGTGSADSLGGGAGGYARSSYACTGGETLDYVVGNAGGFNPTTNHGAAGQASSVSSGSLSITTMTASGGSGSVSGAGGSASGGNQANTTGGAGTASGGGAPAAGIYANTGATYGHGGDGVGTDGPGSTGLVSFYFT